MISRVPPFFEPTMIQSLKSASIVYSAKDIPLFHTLKDTYLSRYKMFVWLKDLDSNMTKNKTSFDDFLCVFYSKICN